MPEVLGSFEFDGFRNQARLLKYCFPDQLEPCSPNQLIANQLVASQLIANQVGEMNCLNTN